MEDSFNESMDQQQYLQTPETNPDDSVFRSPSISTRGRKRKPVFIDGVEITPTMDQDPIQRNNQAPAQTPPKRGRPRGGMGRPRGGGSVRRPAGLVVAQDVQVVPEDTNSLFSQLRRGDGLGDIIDQWIDEYENGNTEEALVRLQQCFIDCCGCKGRVTSIMLQSLEYKDIIRRLTEEFDEESGDYPLIMNSNPWKKFRQNFSDFIQLLIMKCRNGIIFDSRLMDSVIQMLTGLADSQVRAFRHTATFAAMKLSSALVDVSLEYYELQKKNNLQIQTETAKLTISGTNERLEFLMNAKANNEERMNDLCLMIQYIFKSVFVHRYRDIVPDIRGICISELGNWMRVYHREFLEDSYLKYIGWSLYDKIPDVRLKCIQALAPLYEIDELIPKLELFTGKFKDRLVSMVMDKDIDVAVKTCHLVTAIYKVFPHLLTLEDCVPIYETVYSTNRALAVAAGEFLNAKVFSVDGHQVATRDLIQDLVQFFIESNLQNHAAYLVDALIDTNPMVKDWTTMVDMLLSTESEQYDQQLIEVMTCAIKQSATGDTPVGRCHGKKGAVIKDPKQQFEEKSKISQVLIPALPKLLQKFAAEREEVINLTTIPLYFNLEMYPQARMFQYLEELVSMLIHVVDKHSEDEVLCNVAAALSHLSTNISVMQQIESAKLRLLGTLNASLRKGLQSFHEEDNLLEEDEAEILAALRRFTAFFAVEDIRDRDRDLWDLVILLQHNIGRFVDRFRSEVSEKAILYLFLSLAWDLKRLLNEQEANIEQAAKRLKKRRDEFLKLLRNILTDMASGVEHAFKCLCDMLILFNWKLCSDSVHEPVKQLELNLDKEFANKISVFVLDNVFVDPNAETLQNLELPMQIELMHKRRNLLAQYCKLIMHGILPIMDAALVFRNYTKFFTDFGDILKQLLNKCRELDKVACARAITVALIFIFEDIKASSQNRLVDPNDDEFGELKELAKKFCQNFGTDTIKNREAIAMIHKDGIVHSLELQNQQRRRGQNTPSNLAFLEIIIEFSSRLNVQDKKAVLNYLIKHTNFTENEVDREAWNSYMLYKNSLTDKPDDVQSIRSGLPTRGRGRGRGRGRPSYSPTSSEAMQLD